MEELIAQSASLRLYQRETEEWVVYRTEGEEDPKNEDVIASLEILSQSAGETAKPICLALGSLRRPNSRMLATLISLLVRKDGTERRVALAAPTQAWLDMLDIVGVRARFLVVDGPGDLTPGD